MTKGEDSIHQYNLQEEFEANLAGQFAPSRGLTKREWMATILMQGILSNEELRMKVQQDRESPQYVAVEMANKLIKELNKKENEG